VDSNDALEDAEWLLGGVAGLFFAGGGDDGVPPDIGGGFAAGGFFRADQAGGHVRDAVGCAKVEGVVGGVFRVPEDVVVLGGPALGAACAVVVRPDDFVLEAGSASPAIAGKDFVEQDFAVVDFARVDVEEEGTGGGEDAMRFEEAWAQETEVVVEGIGVGVCRGCFVELDRAVALATEAGTVAGVVADGF